MKKIAFVSLMFFVMALFCVNAIPAEDTDDIKIGEATAGLQDIQHYVDKPSFIGVGIIVGVNTFTDSGLRDMYSPMNVYLGASISARHKNFVLQATYEPIAKNRVGHPKGVALPREGPEARAWSELDVTLLSTSLLYTVPIASHSLKPYFGGGLAFYNVYERLTAQDDRGNQYYEEADKNVTGFQVQGGIRFFSKNLETNLELKYSSAKAQLVFDEFNYGGLTLQVGLHYGFDF